MRQSKWRKNILRSVLTGIAVCLGFAWATPALAQTMWRESARWTCTQEPFQAACGGRFKNRCKVAEPRSIETLLFDFEENVVVQDSNLGKSYVPITARTADRRRQISTILFGESGNVVMQFSGGQGVTMTMPPGGGTVAIAFYLCEPAPVE